MADGGDTQTIPAFRWPGRSREGAALLARGDTYDATAAALGVSRLTVVRWHKHREFAQAVLQHRSDSAAALHAEGIARKENRLALLQEQFQRIQSLMAARAAAAQDEHVPGAETGLLAKVTKLASNGDTVDTYELDAPLMREYRDVLKHAAVEIGDWDEKRTVKVDLPALTERARALAGELGLDEAEAVAAAQAIVRGKL